MDKMKTRGSLFVIFFLAQYVGAMLGQLGACTKIPQTVNDFNGPTVPVDIVIESVPIKRPKHGETLGEIMVERTFDFDSMNITYVAAIEFIHDAVCDGNCTDITKVREPWKCNNYVFDLNLYGYFDSPEVDDNSTRIVHYHAIKPQESVVLATVNPGDRFISFRTPFDPEFEYGYLKLGSKTSSPFKSGKAIVRFAFIEEKNSMSGNKTHVNTTQCTLRFHVLVPEKNLCLSQTSMLTVTNYDPETSPKNSIYMTSTPQAESVLIGPDHFRPILDLNKLKILKLMAVSVQGNNWMASYSIEFMYKNSVLYSIHSEDVNFWDYSALLPLSTPLFITNYTSIHYTCNYGDAKHPFIDTPKNVFSKHTIPIGPKPAFAPCILRMQFSSAKCASQVMYDNDLKWLHSKCGDFVTRGGEKCHGKDSIS